MRVVYATMNEIGRRALEELAPVVDVVGVFTVRERGWLFMDPADFSGLAEKHGFPLHRIDDINAPDVAAAIRDLKPDLGMCIGWKQILKPRVLRIPRYGWIGCHPAWLLLEGEHPDPEVFSAPGNEPLQYAIRGRFKKTGTSLQWLKAAVDEGDLFARASVPLDEHETAATLLEKLGAATAALVRDNVQSILDGNPPRLRRRLKGLQPYTKPLTADDEAASTSPHPSGTPTPSSAAWSTPTRTPSSISTASASTSSARACPGASSPSRRCASAARPTPAPVGKRMAGVR